MDGTDGLYQFTPLDVLEQVARRVVDGAVGARFLQSLRRMIENPLMLVY